MGYKVTQWNIKSGVWRRGSEDVEVRTRKYKSLHKRLKLIITNVIITLKVKVNKSKLK